DRDRAGGGAGAGRGGLRAESGRGLAGPAAAGGADAGPERLRARRRAGPGAGGAVDRALAEGAAVSGRLAFGSTGGVERRTEVVALGSGFERRSSPWAHGRRRYLIGAGLRSLDDMAAL